MLVPEHNRERVTVIPSLGIVCRLWHPVFHLVILQVEMDTHQILEDVCELARVEPSGAEIFQVGNHLDQILACLGLQAHVGGGRVGQMDER